MVRNLPFRINDWALPNLDDAVAREKSNIMCGIYKFDVGPLITMVVNIICDLRQQNTLWLQYSVSFSQKWGEGMTKGIVVLL